MNRSRLMLGFHWLTAFLVAASFAVAWVRVGMDDLAARAFWLDVHRAIGLTIFALTLLRLATRVRIGAAEQSELTMPLWIASRAIHFLIYACLIAMPLLGWAQSSAMMRHFKIFGLAIPALVRHDRDLADTFGWWHEQIGWLFVSLIALHAIAALFHHYVLRDDVLRDMMPAPARRRSGYEDDTPAPWPAETERRRRAA